MNKSSSAVAPSGFFYGWVIVAAGIIILTTQSGVLWSFSVFFKPIIADMGWSRASTSSVFSVFAVTHGAFAMLAGWLADKFGPAKVAVACGFITGLGLLLTSQVQSLWQFYLFYSILVGIGISGGFAVITGTTARWFIRRRGLALGIVSAGVGFGVFALVPVAERLINAFGWSKAYIILALFTWVTMIGGALLLRRDPEAMGCRPYGFEESKNAPHSALPRESVGRAQHSSGIPLRAVLVTRPIWMLLVFYFLYCFSVQTIMVHLVNHATDIGISPLLAATLVSAAGASGMAGRLLMGAASDRIGATNSLFICSLMLVVSILWLLITRELWGLFLFALVFGFAYGGEVPQMPVLVARFYGFGAVATLVGALAFGVNIGGAVGAWFAGEIFDTTQSYQIAFVIALLVSASVLPFILVLKRQKAIVVETPG